MASEHVENGWHGGGGYKIINDPVHGHITVPRYCLDFIGAHRIELPSQIFGLFDGPSSTLADGEYCLWCVECEDTPEFQRLRDLKQLGVTHFIFPGASHNRFEHSIGVSVLANRLMSGIRERQPELEVSDRDVKCVTLAGLCHDLGHGPFSHAFEDWLKRMNKPFHHEEMSLKILEHMISENNIDIEQEDVDFIKSLIAGEPFGKNAAELEGRLWMYDVVANKRNSIDVDKWDYLARDCYHLGIKSSYDHSRLLSFSRVINDEICYHAKEAYNIYEMFHTRYSLFKQVYSHRVGKAIEYMIGDAFKIADEELGISAAVDDVSTYCSLLTDNLLRTIESSKSQALAKARKIVRRIRTRDLYKMVDELLLEPSQFESFKKITPEELANDAQKLYDAKAGGSDLPEGMESDFAPSTPRMDSGSSTSHGIFSEFDSGLLHERSNHSTTSSIRAPLSASHFRVDEFTCNYAMQNRNPVDKVHFFSKWDSTDSFPLDKREVSLLIPSVFSERYVRVFCTEPLEILYAQDAARRAFERRGYGNPGPQFTISRSITPAFIEGQRKRAHTATSSATGTPYASPSKKRQLTELAEAGMHLSSYPGSTP